VNWQLNIACILKKGLAGADPYVKKSVNECQPKRNRVMIREKKKWCWEKENLFG
jgi:hypothetical protein